MKNKKLMQAIGVVAVVIIGFYLLNNHIYSEKQGAERMSLSGIVVCLPQKGPGPHTKECMVGLMTPDRKHYKLEMSLMSQAPQQLSVSDRLSASGVVAPPASDEKYDVAGVFNITDSLVVE